MMEWIVGFVLAIGILQIICLLGVFWGMVELRAMQKSTHSIQYVPVDPKFQGVTDELKEALSKDLFDNVV
jgi:hypothetical protein